MAAARRASANPPIDDHLPVRARPPMAADEPAPPTTSVRLYPTILKWSLFGSERPTELAAVMTSV
jgi:hypothetical protein